MIILPGTTLDASVDVRVRAEAAALAAAAERARHHAGAVSDCTTRSTSTDVPEQAQSNCDEVAGWRTFAWIGESGDGIVRIERLSWSAWIPVYYGPLCVNGVAAATPDQLARLGVPEHLADAWGFPRSACQP